jgi:hypothetical protein
MYTATDTIVAIISCYSKRGLEEIYEKFLKSVNFSIWIQKKTDLVNHEWKAHYLKILSGIDVVDRICSRANIMGWTDSSIIEVFGRLVNEIVCRHI